jgi:hypothetical protein
MYPTAKFKHQKQDRSSAAHSLSGSSSSSKGKLYIINFALYYGGRNNIPHCFLYGKELWGGFRQFPFSKPCHKLTGVKDTCESSMGKNEHLSYMSAHILGGGVYFHYACRQLCSTMQLNLIAVCNWGRGPCHVYFAHRLVEQFRQLASSVIIKIKINQVSKVIFE